MSVYFIRAGNFVKIGYAENPRRRLKELQTGNPNKLKLLGAMPGDTSREAEIHAIFSDFRVNGEWFELTTDILAYIEQRQSKTLLKIKKTTPNKKGSYRQSGKGWIEYTNQSGRYYARERWWEKDHNGKWKKKSKYRRDLPSLSPREYQKWRSSK